MPLGLPSGTDFNFPFEPYGIQNNFMENLYNTLEQKKFGIFESPTGTGKSLSLICGSLTWLLEYNQYQKELLKSISEEEFITEKISNDWFSAAVRKVENDKMKKDSLIKLGNIEKYEKKIQNIKDAVNKKFTVPISGNIKNINEEFDELFKDLNEVRENVKRELDYQNSGEDISMMESDFILDTDVCDEMENSVDPSESDQEDDLLKIFYCSRTHSQLSQFVKEIQKTKFKSKIQVVSLASRQNLCINESVLQLSNLSQINERCLDLQKGSKTTDKNEDETIVKKKKTHTSCLFNKQSTIKHVSYQILAEVQDLEQLVTAGQKSKGCPYYASRTSIKDAQLIVLPYQTLLHKGTREACNIKLKDNIVIVDEAHNLLETLANIHSAMLYYNQVCGAHSQLSQYLQRYEKRLSPQNFLYINQIMFFLKAYIKLLSSGPSWNGNDENMNSKSRLMTLQELLHETFTDNMNIFKVVQYAEKSKIAHKLFGFSKMFQGQVKTSPISENVSGLMTSTFLAKMSTNKSKNSNRETGQSENSNSAASSKGLALESDELSCGTPLLSVLEFMRSIICGSSDGRVLVSYEKNVNKSYIKYLLLNPASQFHDIVKQCRSVIVAGGTMSPMDEFRDQLFMAAGGSLDRLVQFSCGHVVPDENILPIVFKEGPGGVKLDFTFKNRNNIKLLDDLGRLLVNICNVIPGGVVVFFPSYDYEEKVNQYFIKSGFIQKLDLKKLVFREPKKANQLDKVLADYVRAVKEGVKSSKLNQRSSLTGALIFSVVGGKMSEGINFSDDLGRCVVMVGMPYPNSTSPELKEKINYLNTHYPVNDGKTAGATFYENLCFKAVNQSIGRSIRHRNDYSSILLLDHRYSLESSIAALPRWIGTQIKVCENFGSAFQLLRKFFSDKKK